MENKIMKLLEENGRVSLMNDILPVVMKEFKNQVSSDLTDKMMQDFIRQNLCAVYAAGYHVAAVPVFDHDCYGNVSVVDFVYEVLSCNAVAVVEW